MNAVQEHMRRRSRDRQRAIRAGTWDGLHDPARAVAHITALHEQMSCRAIAAAAGVGIATVSVLLWPSDTRTRPRGITAATEAALLAVTGPSMAPANARVPALATVRRLHALMRIGWSMRAVAQSAGLSHQTLSGLREDGTTRRALVAAIQGAYDRLSMTPGPSSRSRLRAEAAGWPPPLAWDDDQLDDPQGEPAPGWAEPTCGVDLDEWLFLVRAGELPEVATARCGSTLSAVEKAAARAGRRDVVVIAQNARYAERRAQAVATRNDHDNSRECAA